MSIIDVLIPLAIGLLLVFRQNILLKATSPAEELARKRLTLTRIGYVLIGVAVLYALIAVLRG